MRLLIDTNILIWSLSFSNRLNAKMRDILEDPSNEVLFSAASIWEVAIKFKLGRIDFVHPPERIILEARETGFIELPVRAAVAARVADLPLHHRDPFDRLLVVQAMAEPVHLYTADPLLQVYSELVKQIGS